MKNVRHSAAAGQKQAAGTQSAARQVLSVYELLLRSGGLLPLLIILISTAAEAATLCILMRDESLYYENLFARGALIPAHIGFLLLLLALPDPLRAGRGNVDYTLRRLSVRPFHIFLIEAGYIFLMLLLFWAVCAAWVLSLGFYFTSNISTAENSSVGLLMAIFRIKELRLLCPIGNMPLWIKNILLLLAVSTGIARFNYYLRKSKVCLILPIICAFILERYICAEDGTLLSPWISIAAAAVLTAFAVNSVRYEEKQPEDEPAVSSIRHWRSRRKNE